LRFSERTPIFGGVGLSLYQKQTLYHQLGQLLRSGRALPAALELLAGSSSGKYRGLLRSLQARLAQGDSIPEAFAKQRPIIGEMEISMLSAGGRSGRLAESCQALASYYETLYKARSTILKKCLYPAFIFHFGVLVLALPTLVSGDGLIAYLKETGTTLGFGYAFAGLPIFIALNFLALGGTSLGVDRLLFALPGTGKVRKSFVFARFFATYAAQLEAGVNVMESLRMAAAASHSAVIIQAMNSGIPALREGARVGDILAAVRIFPEALVSAFRVAEEIGGLDQELPKIAGELEATALGRVEALSEWVPRLIYVGIVLLMGWRVVSVYEGVAKGYGKLLDY